MKIGFDSRDDLYPNGKKVLQRQRHRKRILVTDSRRDRKFWSMDRTGDRLDVPRLRTDAVVV